MVHRTLAALAATVQNMRMNHRGPEVLMIEEFLNRRDLVAVVEEVRSERVAGPQRCFPPRTEQHSAPRTGLYSEVRGFQVLFPDTRMPAFRPFG